MISLKRHRHAVHAARAAMHGVKGHPLFRPREDGSYTRSPFVEVETLDLWYEVPVTEEWRAALRLVEQDGALRIAELRIFPNDADDASRGARGEWSGEIHGYRATVPPGGLTASVVRGFRLGAHFIEAQRVLLSGAARNQQVADLWKRLGLSVDRVDVAPQRATDVLRRLARVADVYVKAMARRQPAAIAVASAFNLAYPKARDSIHQARRKGLLLPQKATRGKPEGYLSPLAIQILASMKRKRR